MKRVLRRFAVSLLVVAGLAGMGSWGAIELTLASRDLHDAEELVDQASLALKDGRIRDARTALDEAQIHVLEANETLRGSLVLDAAAWIPLARQNLLALQDSVRLAATVIHGGVRILDVAGPLESETGTLEVSLSDGSIPLDAVAAAQTEIDALSTQLLPLVRAPEPGMLVGPVQEMRDAVYEEAIDRSHQLEVLGRGLELLRQLSGGDGPRRYLLAVANTAEMRGSGGMILNYGVLVGSEGTIDLEDFGRVDELGPTGTVASELVPDDYLARWSGFDALSRFRQANLAGDFTVVAPVLEAMYSSATQLPTTGVIQVDPQGLAAILEGVGPVTVPELGQVTSENVVALTLNEAYLRFPDVQDRTDVLGDVAEAAFQRLVDGEFPSLRPLAESLVEAVDGRHLLMHATSGSTRASIAAFGADGAYPDLEAGDSFAITAQNLAGNKLDYYLDTSLDLTGDRAAGALGAIEATITLSNTAPVGATIPAYIFGPGPGTARLPAGVLRSLVTVYLPLGTSVEDVAGDATLEPVASGTEAGRPYASFIVDVPAGERRTVRLSLQLPPPPPGRYDLVVVPSPRVRPTTVRVDIAAPGGAVRGELVLDRSWRLVPDAQPAPVVGPAFR